MNSASSLSARRSAHLPNIDMTPMLDVVFILLIFFVVTASFLKEAVLPVGSQGHLSFPAGETHAHAILLAADGTIWLDRKIIDIDAVRARLAAIHAGEPEASFVVNADADSKAALLVTVLDQARLAGVNDIQVQTR